MNSLQIRDWLVAEVARAVRTDASRIDVRAPFDSYGLSSTDAVTLSGELERLVGRELSPTLVYDHPTIADLAAFLGETSGPPLKPDSFEALPSDTEAIAIVGLGCRFPGADSPAAFWRLLRDGTDMIRDVPRDRWDAKAYYDPDPSIPGKASSRWGGFLDQVDRFDPFFFGISPGEAERMDPQQRLLLELAYEAVEDAGYSMPRLAGSRTGVMIGISINEYASLQFAAHELLSGHSGTGAALSIAANRISYFFDLHGPSFALDTACSSSLAAVHYACRSLRAGECDLALAGGVNIILSPAHSIAFTKAGVLAPDGRCKPFDAAADGYVRGEGGGLVVLKPLMAALNDGDMVYAVIRGSAIGQDGRTNGLMAPNGAAQQAVLLAAYADAGISPAGVQYIEAHGTGTLLGDSIEARALGAVLSPGRLNGPCSLGSVKSNFGHLEAAAGIAGLIKVALSLKHRSIPASLHFKVPNPHTPFESLGLRVAHRLEPWPDHSGPALAGVSSFGFGGTNVHVVVEEGPHPTPTGLAGESQGASSGRIFPLSARSRDALFVQAQRLRDFVAMRLSDPALALDDLSFTAGARRTHHDHRLAVIARSSTELVERLEDFLGNRSHPGVLASGEANQQNRKLAFIFSGQGSQWPGMGRELLQEAPVFRLALQRCDEALYPNVGWSVLDQVRGESKGPPLREIDVVQPVLFAIQVGLAAMWQAWGFEPDSVVGHSMGEVAAAHVAGALSLDDAARVISMRSRLLKRISGRGGMVVVGLSAEETAACLTAHHPGLFIAASNGPRTTVVGGESLALGDLAASLERQGTFCRQVNVDVAAHGPEAAGLADELRRSLRNICPRTPRIPFFSALIGGRDDNLLLDADYWARNLTEPVNFAGAVQSLLREGACDCIDISPHPVLQGAVQQAMLQLGHDGMALHSCRREEAERVALLQSVAALYTSGREIYWARLHPDGGRPIPLPSYPWQRQRYWLGRNVVEAHSARANRQTGGPSRHPFLGRRVSLASEPRAHVWETGFDHDDVPFLTDHQVDGEIVVPASVFLEIALSAAAEVGLADSHVLEETTFHRRLTLPRNGSRSLQVVLMPGPDDTHTLSIFSRDPVAGEVEWELHASGSFVRQPAASDRSEVIENPPSELKAQFPEPVSPDDFYRGLAGWGLEYGTAFRAITEIRRRAGESLGRVSLPESLRKEAGQYRIHPVLLDGALQVVAAATGLSGKPESEVTFLPAGCKRLKLFTPSVTDLWSHVVLRTIRKAADGIEADISLLDGKGIPIGRLDGFRLARVDRTRRSEATTPHADTWFYRVRWQPSSWTRHSAASPVSDRRGHWIIVADRHGLAEALTRRLETEGHDCRLIGLEQTLIGRVDAEQSPVRGVILLSSTEAASPGDGPAFNEAQAIGCNAALSLVRDLAAGSGTLGTPRLWLITQGAQPVLPGEAVAVAQAPLWGLGKSIAFELPQFQCTLVDLDPGYGVSQAVEMLSTELLSADSEDQIALRGEQRLVARLLPAAALGCPVAPVSTRRSIRSDATYLITGGLGGIGITVAQWMVERGARNLFLVGRSPPSPAASAIVKKLRRAGATVAVVAMDVSSAGQVADLVRRIQRTMSPLRGLVHAAGVVENLPVVTLDAACLSRVLAPKVAGAWNLHRATQGLDLDFFCLFSSAVSVLGSPGQANYAAANSFLDALAYHRRSSGLPAISINWGPWSEVGLVAGDPVVGRGGSAGKGVKGIDSRRGLEILGDALGDPGQQVTVLPFDLRSLLDLYPAAARIPLFAEVGARDSHVSRLYARPRLRQEFVAPRNDIERQFAELWRQTLRIDRVGVHDSFFELGGDSVLAAQILTSAHRSFGVQVDFREAFQSFTVENLALQVEGALIARVNALSEAEVHQLLQD